MHQVVDDWLMPASGIDRDCSFRAGHTQQHVVAAFLLGEHHVAVLDLALDDPNLAGPAESLLA